MKNITPTVNTSIDMNEILNEVNSELNLKRKRKDIIDFCDKYSQKKFEDISWNELCDDVNRLKCYKFGLIFLIKLLERNLYNGIYLDILTKYLPIFQNIRSLNSTNYKLIFCNNRLPNLLICQKESSQVKISYYFMYTKNLYIKELYIKFLESERKYNRWCSLEIVEIFEISLSNYTSNIQSYKDFNDCTFWQQINYYKNYFKNNESLYEDAIKATCNFYRWLVNTYTEYNFFENSFTMTKYLLFNTRLIEIIKEDYYVTTFNPANNPGDRKKICFILRGFEDLSTRITNEDFSKLNLSTVEKSKYRKLIISYVLSSTSATIATTSGQTSYICDALSFVTKLKSEKDYPNPSLDYMTNQEAVFIRNYFNNDSLSVSTNNNKIGAIRRFLRWAKDNNSIQFDDMFFDYLIQYEEPNKNTAKAIPDEDLVKINDYIINDSKNNFTAKLIYAIFHLALETEFRVSQICSLTIDCIKPSVKPNQFMITSSSKTSCGTQDSFVISDITYHILMNIIEDTEIIRENCNIESLKNYIFLYNGRLNSVSLMTSGIFSKYLKDICVKLKLPTTYTAANVRDSHMTKAFEYSLRNKKSDAEFSVLSGHRRIDTAKSHYIEMELEKMLESTYGIVIGEELIQTNSKILDVIPKELDNKENDVENGCGKCTAPNCVITSSLPCMACKYFITTVAHEKFFIKAIDNVQRLIEQTNNRHDKEDLVTIKGLYLLYLKAIRKHKEEAIND